MSEYKKELIVAAIMAVTLVSSLAFVSNYFFPSTQPPPEGPPSLPPPGPAPPVYTIAEIRVETTVMDVNMTFLYHYEPPSNSSVKNGTLTSWEEPLQQPPPPSPPPPLGPQNITAYDIYEIVVVLRIDSIVEYKSEISDLLKQGEEIRMRDTWVSPHYVDGVLEEMPYLKKGDKIRFGMKLYSVKEELDLSDPNSYWWLWSYPDVEVLGES